MHKLIIFIKDGIVEEMLTDGMEPLETEVVYLDKEADDYDRASKYQYDAETKMHLLQMDYTTKSFDEE